MPIQIETAYKLDIKHKKDSSFPAWTHTFPAGIPNGTMKLIIKKTSGQIEVIGAKTGNSVTYTPTLAQMSELAVWDYSYETRAIEGSEINNLYIYWTLTIF